MRFVRSRVISGAFAVASLAVAPVGTGCGGPGAAWRDTGGAPAAAELMPATAPEILDAVRDSGRQAILVNVWATWCPPCLEEMPEILEFRRDYRGRGVEVILVSGDFDTEADEVVGFLERMGVGFPTYIKKGDDMEFIEAMSPDWTGALPASFLYDGEGTLRHFWEGKVTYAGLEEKVLQILDGSHSQVGKEEDS